MPLKWGDSAPAVNVSWLFFYKRRSLMPLLITILMRVRLGDTMETFLSLTLTRLALRYLFNVFSKRARCRLYHKRPDELLSGLPPTFSTCT